jgi:HmuY protein
MLTTLLAGCGGDDPATTDATSTSASTTSTGGSGGAGGSGSGGAGGEGTSASTSTATGTSTSTSTGTGGAPPMCTAARDQALGPIDTVSTGDVTVLSTAGATRKIYVDASAGGTMNAAQNPWIYLSLKTGTKVAVSDPGSFTSKDWDLALKRPLLRTNDGDGGPGKGGAVLLDGKLFDAVTAADAANAALVTEAWFDEACNLKADPTGAITTTFNGWYDYDQATNKLSPHPGTFIVRGGDGALYKVAILNYYANPDGTTGMAGGRYVLQIGPLQ